MGVNMRSVIKLENAFIFIITIAVYFKLEFSIWLFLLLLLVPDIFMLGYVINRKQVVMSTILDIRISHL